MGEMLAQLFQGLRTYGKTVEDLDATLGLFELVMEEYRPEQVKAGMLQWLKTSNQMPTPADIIGIIDPPPKEPDRAVYVSISKKAPELRTSEDWSFMREYEDFARRNL